MGSFSLVGLVAAVFSAYQVLIIVWCILSWLPTPRNGLLADLIGAIDSLVRPYIELFRRFLPPFGGLDFSPILAILVLHFIERVFIGILA